MEFTARDTGKFEARIVSSRFEGFMEWVGVAWHRRKP